MSADMQNMIARLQMSLAGQQQNQPSIYGLQAQQDPNATAAILKKLQDQEYVAQQGNPGSDWADQFGQAGKKDFARMGQGIGNLLGIGQPPQYDNSNVQAQRQAIVQGKGQLQQLLQSGVDPNQAQMQVLSNLAQAGVPGAAEALSKANDDAQKLATSKASAYKDTQQGAAAADEIQNRAQQRDIDNKRLDQSTAKDTWQTIGQGSGYIVQKNGLGEIRSTKNSDASSTALSNVTPDGMQAMVNWYKENNKAPPGIARSPAVAGAFWQAVASDPDASQAQVVAANAAGLHANTQALAQTQKQLSATTTYLDTMDKNIEKARTYGNQLDFSDVNGFNKAVAAWAKGTSDPTYAKYNLFFDAVANESAKIKSGSLGNVAVSDSMRKETADILSKNIGNGGMNAVFDALKEEGQNRVDSLTAQRDNLVGAISKKPGAPAPVPQQAAPATQAAPQGPASAAPPPAASAPISMPATGMKDGQTATNPQTGQKLIVKGGMWVPAQ